MGFEGLLGNERLKENLRMSVGRGRISHFYLISGPAGSGKHTLARLLGAALLCRETKKPCLQCSACRKVMANTHPDFITVDDPEKKTVPVDLIRQARADIYVQPNESERKIYLFPRAQDMGIPGQNALLKVLEEPPAYGVFLLLTDNPEALLPTVRSRCTELKLSALPEQLLRSRLEKQYPQADAQSISAAISRSGGYLGQALQLLQEGISTDPQAKAFAESFARRDTLGLLQVLVPMERWKRDQVLPVFSSWINLLENALACRCGMTAASPIARTLSAGRSPQELMQAIAALQKAMEYTQGNVSVAAVCGYLEWALR